uniref:putative type VI secretion system effector n=1 Tax=Acinetobacter haemolyticus TaxID=29430 RepID=UPI003F5444C3
SGGMGAAATLSGINGFPGYYIHFEIDGEAFYAAFTGVFFKEGEEVYVVYDEDIEQNFNVLAIMNKNNKLLGMAVPFGHKSLLMRKSHEPIQLIKVALALATICSIVFYFVGLNNILEYIYIYIYIYIFSFVCILAIGYSVKKKFNDEALITEEIYKILGIFDIEKLNQSFNQNHFKPYIDENNRMYDDVYNYTQFLSYDPQPLVDVKTDESHLR